MLWLNCALGGASLSILGAVFWFIVLVDLIFVGVLLLKKITVD